jgi:hypothetical protein
VRPAGSYKPTPVASVANLVLAPSARLPVLVQSAHSLPYHRCPVASRLRAPPALMVPSSFLWCRCSNTALRSFSWFLGEVAFELLLFLRASSAPLCVVVACTPPPPPPCCSFPLARASLATDCIRRCSAVGAGGQWVHSTSVLCCRTGCAPSVSLLPFVAVVRARAQARSTLCVVVGGALVV